MPKLIAVSGLPGSAKTFYIHKQAAGFGYISYSDITQCGWLNWADLVQSLRNGYDCITDSATFTTPQGRKDLEDRVNKTFMGEVKVEIEWRFFENNLTACLTNIVRDGIMKPHREYQVRIQRLFERAADYVIPDGYDPIPVFNQEYVELPFGRFKVSL